MTSWYARICSLVHGGSKGQLEDQDEDLDQTSQRVLSLLSSAVVVVDRDGRVVRSSPAAYRFSIVSQDRIENAQVNKAIAQAWQSHKVSHFSLITQTPDALVDVSAYPDKPEETVSGASRPNWLKVTVGAISSDFVLVLIDDTSEAKRFEQTRQAFVEHVSQQLLKPVSALEQLAASVNTLAEEPVAEAGAIKERMESISQDAQELTSYSSYLRRMLSDLLLLLRAQEQVDTSSANVMSVNTAVRTVIDSLQTKAEEAGVKLSYQDKFDLQVHGDSEQIRAAVRKLVENAIRYSPKGSTVSIIVKASAEGNHALIQVIDRGQGIAKTDQEHVFERFYRGADQTQSSKVGVGLGLSIAKHVALTHHGSLTLWSAPGQGSTFTLTLPLAQAMEDSNMNGREK